MNQQMDIDALPRTIRMDIDVLTQLKDILRTWKSKKSEREVNQEVLDMWQYVKDSLTVYYEITLSDEYQVEVQDNVVMYDRKIQLNDVELEVIAELVETVKTSIPLHLSHITSHIESQFNYKCTSVIVVVV